jgi:fatty acid desaturase
LAVTDSEAFVPREWRKVPRWYGLRATLRLLGGFCVVVAAIPWAVLYISPWTLLPAAPLLGVLAYKLTLLMHDCSHQILFPAARHNRLVGNICAGILGSDFRQFTRIHWQHHQQLGAPDDSQGPDYLGLREASGGRILWHLLRPLIGYNLVFKLVQYNTGKMLRAPAGKTPDTSPTARPALLPIGVAQAAIVLLVTGFGQLWWLVFLYPACAATISQFLSQTRGFAEHVAPAGAESETFVRTHSPNLVDGALFFALNFNYHLEHHLHPSIPSRYLPDLHRLIRSTHHTDTTLSPGIFTTIWRRRGQARKGPERRPVPAPAGNRH